MKNMAAVTSDSNFQPNKKRRKAISWDLVTKKMTVLRYHFYFFRHGLQQLNWSGMFYDYGETKQVSIQIVEMSLLDYLICIKVWKHCKSFQMEKADMYIRKRSVVMRKLMMILDIYVK